ncbi:hypothetical protein IH981_02970 [Patescibacteria group bacterium]|nr:hypothetical protein [Patescibacteria group bacterium]
MQGKSIGIVVLGLVGIYFLIFHTEPLPFNHDSIGLPPFHIAHAIFGIILLGAAGYLWKKGMKSKSQT